MARAERRKTKATATPLAAASSAAHLPAAPAIEGITVFCNQFILAYRTQPGHLPEAVSIRQGGKQLFSGRPPRILEVRDEKVEAGNADAVPSGFPVSLLGIDILPRGRVDLKRSFDVSVDTGEGSTTATLNCEILSYPIDKTSAFGRLILSGARKGFFPPEANSLVFGPPNLPEPQASQFAVDAVCRSLDGLMIDGWVQNAAEEHFFIVSDDLTTLATRQDIQFKPRPDVSKHLRTAGLPVVTHDHGFVAHLRPITAVSGLTAFKMSGRSSRRLGGISPAPNRTKAEMLDLVWGTVASGHLPSPPLIRNLIHPLLARPEPRLVYDVAEVQKGTRKPVVSVIVPFYGEWFFIRSIAMMQLWFPSDYEWIIVSDDPAITGKIIDHLSSRSGLLANRTVVVKNATNYGFSSANNIGVDVSQGDYLLFMNSDIWIEEATPVEDALSQLSSGAFGAMGFRLLFEDGSLQHDGMAFVRNSAFHDLFLAEHLGKGLPPSEEGEGLTEVAAVTGALLMISRQTFRAAGGFSQKFVRGDFEDADLCMRLKRMGRKIGLLRTNNIFHLERQSIRKMGTDVHRAAVTACNCVTFNDLWREELLAYASSPQRPDL